MTATLLERLEALKPEMDDGIFDVLVNPDGPEAAATIRSLQAENERLRGGLVGCCRRLRVCAVAYGNSAESVEALMEQFESLLATPEGEG